MDKSKHTPGKWQVTKGSSHVFVNEGTGHDGVICKMSDRSSPLQWAADAASEENSANARLIASAPALLEACKEALSAIGAMPCTCNEDRDCQRCHANRKIKTAIAQAETE